MDTKLVLICGLLLIFALDVAQADFLYNRISPKPDELESLGLKCIPGRTVMKVSDRSTKKEEEDSDYEDGRRSHMRFSTDDESCQMCVCSTDGKDEYCSNRPAMNVNECMVMAAIMKRFKSNKPYDHERILSQMIRRGNWNSLRDLIWHDEEIPSIPHAKCQRSHSYYSNSLNANDTDVEVDESVTSLLDYKHKKSVCFYCVCSVVGDTAGCIKRNPWFCQWYRDARRPDAARQRYKLLFQQDRPAYFRDLSYRLRRTMDDGMFDLIDNGGDSLCCGHSDGHRRQIHHQVRSKIRNMKSRLNRENLMGGHTGGDYVDFVVNND